MQFTLYNPMMSHYFIQFQNLKRKTLTLKLYKLKQIVQIFTSLISFDDNAPGISCLFANTNNVAPASLLKKKQIILF